MPGKQQSKDCSLKPFPNQLRVKLRQFLTKPLTELITLTI